MLGAWGCCIWGGYVLGEATGLWGFITARVGGLSREARP